jgi:transmembrane sensor
MKAFGHHRPSDAEAIEATAAAWLAQRDDGLTPEQEADFAQWRGADVRHEAAVARLEAAWTALQQLRDFRPEARVHPDRNLLRPPPKRRRGLPFPALAATVALAASLAVAAVWWVGSSRREAASRKQHYATTVDGYERVSLADGTMVELNSASEVAVQFSPAERRVRLVRGEAHFTVAKNKARPFLVEAGTIAVHAVGTAFNVRLGGKDVEVLVTEGKVAVATPENLQPRSEGGGRKSGTGGQIATRVPDEGGRPEEVEPKSADRRQRSEPGRAAGGTAVGTGYTELGANERVVIPVVPVSAAMASIAPPVIERVAPEAIREALAWQGPRLVFVDTPLADAIAQFNRRNQLQLELADAELGALPIGGSFRAENVDAFVRLLVSDGDIAVERPAPNRVVLRKVKPEHRPK